MIQGQNNPPKHKAFSPNIITNAALSGKLEAGISHKVKLEEQKTK
jgi:hypothetical protein